MSTYACCGRERGMPHAMPCPSRSSVRTPVTCTPCSRHACKSNDSGKCKIVHNPDCADRIAPAPPEVKGYTAGVFDLFHVGHLRLLWRAKEQCTHLTVGVTTDELCMEYKMTGPTIPYEQRVEIIRGLACVDTVVAQTELDKVKAWFVLRYDKLFVGDDWQCMPQWNDWERQLGYAGATVVYLPRTPDVSSTGIDAVRHGMLSDNAVEDYIRTLKYVHDRHVSSADVETIVGSNIRKFANRVRHAIHNERR